MNKDKIIERQANENLKLANDNKDLQERIDKAIEYISKIEEDNGEYYYDDTTKPLSIYEILETILSILRGEDND